MSKIFDGDAFEGKTAREAYGADRSRCGVTPKKLSEKPKIEQANYEHQTGRHILVSALLKEDNLPRSSFFSYVCLRYLSSRLH